MSEVLEERLLELESATGHSRAELVVAALKVYNMIIDYGKDGKVWIEAANGEKYQIVIHGFTKGPRRDQNDRHSRT